MDFTLTDDERAVTETAAQVAGAADPWAALAEFARCPAPPCDGDSWRINFSRVQWDVELVDGQTQKIAGRPEHNWVWSPQGLINMHVPSRWGVIRFE